MITDGCHMSVPVKEVTVALDMVGCPTVPVEQINHVSKIITAQLSFAVLLHKIKVKYILLPLLYVHLHMDIMQRVIQRKT